MRLNKFRLLATIRPALLCINSSPDLRAGNDVLSALELWFLAPFLWQLDQHDAQAAPQHQLRARFVDHDSSDFENRRACRLECLKSRMIFLFDAKEIELWIMHENVKLGNCLVNNSILAKCLSRNHTQT